MEQQDSDVVQTPQPVPMKRTRTSDSRIVSPDAEKASVIPASSLVVLSTPTSTTTSTARRSILQDDNNNNDDPAPTTIAVTPPAPSSKRRLVFGRYKDSSHNIPHNVKTVYKLVKKQTGSIGGNGSFGAIYGELTCGSMQKMIQLMKHYTCLDGDSKFVDVGSGLGKPNLHVAQDPGVAFSYGVEMERVRWLLGTSNLKQVLDYATKRQETCNDDKDESRIGYKCLFQHGNILDAKTFDPFTHVYMFSIGFPPSLWVELSKMFNTSSSSRYLICYHSPRDIIDKYGFHVELMTQTQTSMHGSKEGHMGYIYKRFTESFKLACSPSKCDALFEEAHNVVCGSNLNQMVQHVDKQLEEQYCVGRRTTRSSGVVMTAETPRRSKKRKL